MASRPKSAAAGGKSKKSVGFSLQGTKIEAPTDDQYGPTNFGKAERKYEFKVSKAQEIEEFRNIPRFNHSPLAVIHPPGRREKLHVRRPPKNLQFDGARVGLQPIRYEPKNLPEHLIKPPIDEETLIRLKAMSKTKATEGRGGKRKTIAEQKREKEEQKRRSDLQFKIKRSDKILKTFFAEVKKILDKSNEDVIAKDLTVTVEKAKLAETSGRFIRLLYICYESFTKFGNKMDKNLNPTDVAGRVINRNDFVNFIKFYFKDPSETQITDVFMNVTKKLQAMLNPVQEEPDLSMTMGNGLLGGKKNANQLNQDMSGVSKKQAGPYGLTKQELDDIRLDVGILDTAYEKWAKEDDSLSGVMNSKLTKVKNADIRLKLDAWKSRAGERKKQKKFTLDHGKELRKIFDQCKSLFSVDKYLLDECQDEYNAFCDVRKNHNKDCKVINNFLCELPEGSHQILEVADLDRLKKNEEIKMQQRVDVITEFITSVKQECVINQDFFIFQDIPDMILKKRYARKDYENIMKVLLKVKTRYLAEKAMLFPEKPLDFISQITDDDLVPLKLFDYVLSELENKLNEKKATIKLFISECSSQIAKIITKLGIDAEKTKLVVSQSVLAHHINKTMEDRHTAAFQYQFKHRQLYQVFAKNKGSDDHGADLFKSSKEFNEAFKEVMKLEQSSNRFYPDYEAKLEREMQKFNGKIQVGDHAETNSEMTTATRRTGKSTATGKSRRAPSTGFGSPSMHGDDIEDGLERDGEVEGEAGDQASVMNAQDDEEEVQETAEEKMKRLAAQPAGDYKHIAYNDIFVEDISKPSTKFDPKKKFGVIEDQGLLYENITTSYPLNLPTEHYQKYINKTMPTKEAGNGKWYIRPHHLETLTDHPNSVKDDVLNTRYISHYNQEYGKKEEVNHNADAIVKIEEHLEGLKSKMMSMQVQRGEDPFQMEELLEQTRLQGHQEYEKFINDRTRFDSKVLIIDAYEGILHKNRIGEKTIVNRERFKEYEKNRPPQANWYELKSGEFAKELYRNRMTLKPDGQNNVYLETLQDKNLY